MNKKIIAFGNSEIEKHLFYYHKNPISLDEVDIDKLLISKTISFDKKGFKHVIGCKHDEKVKPLCIMLPKMSGYKQSFNETKYAFFLIKNDKLQQEKYLKRQQY